MSTSPIAQTLFRFVSLRNPELSNETEKDKRFIFQPAAIQSGHFYTAVNNRPAGSSKWSALVSAAQTFPSPYTTEQALKDAYPALYNFSVWLVRNRSTSTDEQLRIAAAGITPLTSPMLSSIWNNLFYQVVSQKSFYLKEALIHLLLANHLVSNRTASPSPAKVHELLAEARLVLPSALFQEENSTMNGAAAFTSAENKGEDLMAMAVEEAQEAAPSEEMKKQQASALAELQIKNYEGLQKELEPLDKQYRQEYDTAYTRAREDYDAETKPILDEYQRSLEEARKKWCGVRNPAIPYDPNDPCQQPDTVPKPELPKFQFNHRPEIDPDHLQSNLSEDSFNALKELLGESGTQVQAKGMVAAAAPAASFAAVSSFQDVYSLIKTTTTKAQTVLLTMAPDPGKPVVSIGGVLVPVTPFPVNPDNFNICPKPVAGGKINFDLAIDVPDSSWQVASMLYHLRYTNGSTNTNGYYTTTRTGNQIYLKNLFNQGIPNVPSGSLSSLDGVITFTNGAKKSFAVNRITTDACFTGKLTDLEPSHGGNDGNPWGDGLKPFVPKGYGFKQIGIADYRKVEQSVQCYVEGEVSHIENIMAREHKLKSTRRLRRSEETITQTSEMEKEQLTDTTTSERFEMQSEIAKVLQESKDFSANANFQASYGVGVGGSMQIGAGVNFATHTSKEESIRQAVTHAKEVTEKALDRVVTKIKEERISKIIDEFEENYQHGFDNTKGDKHVVGVYRWVDKLYKNQIYNYGKRLMFEFMIPQPSKLHQLGMKELESGTSVVLIKPEDPRAASAALKMADYTMVTEATAKYWAGKYNAEISPMPELEKSVGKAFSYTTGESMGAEWEETAAGSNEVNLPEGYQAYRAKAVWHHSDEAGFGTHVLVAGRKMYNGTEDYIGKFIDVIPVSFSALGHHSGSVNVELKCQLTEEAKKKWQQKTFQGIINAYEVALEEYNNKLAQENAKASVVKGTNPGFYRQIENTVLRKNCISYLIDDLNASSQYRFGQAMYHNPSSFTTNQVKLTQDFNNYAALVKFMEQAFEWDIMSYNLYPFYWGDRNDWKTLYQFEDADPLFRSFMQSGMARVIVTVRPGFEEAVQFFLSTGLIWNGGQVPVIGEPLFLSIVDELRQIKGESEGKAWVTRLPTSLTILQADSIGLKVEKALPCNCEDTADFEDPSQIPCNPNFEITQSQMNGETPTGKATLKGVIKGAEGIAVKVVLKNLNGTIVDLTYADSDGNWEMGPVPADKCELLIDATNKLPDEQFVIINGSKEHAVTLEDGNVYEFTLEVKRK